MPVFSRYDRDDLQFNGKGLKTPRAVKAIRRGLELGVIRVIKTLIVTEGDRLDTIAAECYGDARYWWVLAAASDIGWSLQVPPGTLITVPDLKNVERIVG